MAPLLRLFLVHKLLFSCKLLHTGPSLSLFSAKQKRTNQPIFNVFFPYG
jgi:hypothetical protein